jgi:hypothetical protein
MTEIEQKFYCQIGLISTGFAKLEHLIREIIHLLMNTDDEFISQLVIQENSINQNQKLMLKLNKYRQTEEDKIVELNKKIDSLRINRNLFIHGDWDVYDKEGHEVLFVCSTTKVTFKKVTYGTVTRRNTHDAFNIKELEQGVEKIQECVALAKEIVDLLENTSFL